MVRWHRVEDTHKNQLILWQYYPTEYKPVPNVLSKIVEPYSSDKHSEGIVS